MGELVVNYAAPQVQLFVEKSIHKEIRRRISILDNCIKKHPFSPENHLTQYLFQTRTQSGHREAMVYEDGTWLS